jgi:hypothetical protein
MIEDMLTEQERDEYIGRLFALIQELPELSYDIEWGFRHASAQTCCNAIYPIFQARKARGG